MLEHTFVHIPGIGKATEQRLWEQGIRTWAEADGVEWELTLLSFSARGARQ